MALKQANTLAPSNVSATGFALADARHIGGHKVVSSLTALYALQDWQLLNPEETDTAMALGQQWYVKGDGFYRLTNWANRKIASGWRKVVDPTTLDTTLFQIVSALPTTGINKNKIYLLLSERSENKNVYAEYLYTGDTANYDASKWEKLGETGVKIIVDTALSDTSVNPVQNKVVNSAIEGLKTSVDNVKSTLDSNVNVLKIKNQEQDKEIAKKLNASAYVVDAALSTISTNPVQNKAVNTALSGKLDRSSYVVDTALSASSANPVQNKVVNTALGQKVNTTTFNTEMAKKLDKTTKASDTVLGLVQTGHVTSDGELPLKVDADGKGYVVIESMSIEDIEALFK